MVRRVKIVEFDGYEIKLQQMGIKQQLEIEEINNNKKNMGDLLYPMLINCCVDENNEPLFDEESVNQIPTEMAFKLFDECLEVNRLEKNDLEDRAKNS